MVALQQSYYCCSQIRLDCIASGQRSSVVSQWSAGASLGSMQVVRQACPACLLPCVQGCQ
jgi:hypothetical protein